jgi:hypothetical protein
MTNKSDLWVLTFVVDDSDPNWEVRNSVVGKPEDLAAIVNINKLPYGARLLKGKQASRYIKQSLKEERRYQREQKLKQQAGGRN